MVEFGDRCVLLHERFQRANLQVPGPADNRCSLPAAEDIHNEGGTDIVL